MPGTYHPGAIEGAAGLIIVRQDDPVGSARAIARELDAPVAVGGQHVSKAVASWPSLRRGPHPGSAVDLDRLGERTLRAEAVVERTRRRAEADLKASVQTALAIHPDTLRRAADNYLDALDALDNPEDAGPEPRTWLVIAGVNVALIVAVAGAIAGFGAIGVGVGLAIVVICVAIRLMDRFRRPVSIEDLEATAELTRRRWEDLAGEGADPEDIEAVARRFDPQADVITDLVGLSPAVRAAEQALVDHRIAWVRGWRETLEFQPGDQAAGADPETLDRVRSLLATDASSAVVVIADPYGGLDEYQAARVYDELADVPTGIRAVVVLGPATEPALVGASARGPRSRAGRDGASPDTPVRPETTGVTGAIAPGAPGTTVVDAAPGTATADETTSPAPASRSRSKRARRVAAARAAASQAAPTTDEHRPATDAATDGAVTASGSTATEASDNG